MRQPVSNAISAHFWEIKRSLPDLLAYRGHTKTAVVDYFGGYTLLDSTLHFWIGVNSPIRMTVTVYKTGTYNLFLKGICFLPNSGSWNLK